MVDSIYLSPHLDDVALSCGGQVHQLARGENGRGVLVVTIMAGAPRPGPVSAFARQQHADWGFAPDIPDDSVVQTVVQARRAEDEVAGRILGATVQHWTVPDCIYRRHPISGEPLYTSDEALFGVVHPAEEGLIAELAVMLSDLPLAGRVVAPLGVGNHVDHQLTRLAAEARFGFDLWYYEDYPYVQWDRTQVNRLTAGDEWRAELIPLDETAVDARLAAIEAYSSQIDKLFSGREAMRRAISQFIYASGGERLWRRE